MPQDNLFIHPTASSSLIVGKAARLFNRAPRALTLIPTPWSATFRTKWSATTVNPPITGSRSTPNLKSTKIRRSYKCVFLDSLYYYWIIFIVIDYKFKDLISLIKINQSRLEINI